MNTYLENYQKYLENEYFGALSSQCDVMDTNLFHYAVAIQFLLFFS